jgi:putative ABC transport system permease protein
MNGVKDDWRVVGILISSNMATTTVVYTAYDDLTHFMKSPNMASLLRISTTNHDGAFQEDVSDDVLAFLDLRDIRVLRATTWASLAADTFGGFDILINVLFGMAIIVAMVGGLGLAGTMSLNVLERTREIGVMRAVGASTGTIRRLFIIEGVMIGMLSAVIALPLSVPGSIGFGTVLGQVLTDRPLPYMPTLIGPILWFVIIMVISMIASLMPAQRASQISVREALAYE